MSILETVYQIFQKYFICPHCLGRMFALLGTDTTNYKRGRSLLLSLTLENHRLILSQDNKDEIDALNKLKILASGAYFLPAQKVLKKEGLELDKIEEKPCYLCKGIFLRFEIHTSLQIVFDISNKCIKN